MANTLASHSARIRDWCSAEGLSVTGESSSGHVVVAATIDGQRVDVDISFTDSKAVLHHELTVPSDALSLNFPGSESVELPTFDELFNRMIMNRWGPLVGTARQDTTRCHVTLECSCFLEDLSRTALVAALTEVVKARRVFDTMVHDISTQREALRKLDAAYQTAPQATTAAIGEAPLGGDDTSLTSPRSWRPTHTTHSLVRTWPQPDGSIPSTTQLDPHLEVMVIETRGEWAHIVCSNNWSAWVNKSELQPLQT